MIGLFSYQPETPIMIWVSWVDMGCDIKFAI